VLALAPYASTSTRLPCFAFVNVPLLTYCKIRYVSKFTATSPGSPCDSTAFLLLLLREGMLSLLFVVGMNVLHTPVFSTLLHIFVIIVAAFMITVVIVLLECNNTAIYFI